MAIATAKMIGASKNRLTAQGRVGIWIVGLAGLAGSGGGGSSRMLSFRARISSISRSSRLRESWPSGDGELGGADIYGSGTWPDLGMGLWYSTRPWELARTPSIRSRRFRTSIVKSNLFRFNLVDADGAMSIVGPPHGLKVLAAACSREPRTIAELLEFAQPYDSTWIQQVRTGLMIFDEHNVGEVDPGYEPVVANRDDASQRSFRIIDQVTRTRSMVPARLGLVIVNVRTQRIIQIHNSYAELRRKGRGRIRAEGRPTRSLFHYELPEAWSIVP